MVQLRTLSSDEMVSAFPKRGHIDLTDYVDALSQINTGEAAEVELNGLSRRSLKRRIGMAARQIGVAIKWARTSDEDRAMVFQVKEAQKAAAKARASRTRRARS